LNHISILCTCFLQPLAQCTHVHKSVIRIFFLQAGTLSVDASPGFVYAVTPQYILTIIVDDGTLSANSSYTVDIIATTVSPTFDNLPGNTSVDEDTPNGVIHTVTASDGDSAARTFSLTSITPSTSLFSLNATSKVVETLSC